MKRIMQQGETVKELMLQVHTLIATDEDYHTLGGDIRDRLGFYAEIQIMLGGTGVGFPWATTSTKI